MILVTLICMSLALHAMSFNIMPSYILGPSSPLKSNMIMSSSALPKATSTFTRSKDGMITFGTTIDLRIAIPTRDAGLIDKFILNPQNILDATWDKDKVVKLKAETEYLLLFKAIPLLGRDAISPEIIVDLSSDMAMKSTGLKSKSWDLKGNSGLLKDSAFLKSFDIKLEGHISTLNAPINSAVGSVTYRVQGKVPFMFRVTPTFIMEGIINLIQNRIVDFAKVQFTAKFVHGFNSYAERSRTANIEVIPEI
eukprot:gene2984-5856_t